MSRTAFLIINSSEADSDICHGTGFFVPDSVIFFECENGRIDGNAHAKPQTIYCQSITSP